ncbi:BRIX1 [Symbiodinium natans]|uniref:BRIX1 protein n=1 Tax=Symbiodinium natans TaxID=878477 RepID=A0A812R9C3_9DINO|nr:BRIX1 [Symbiodinium natans]
MPLQKLSDVARAVPVPNGQSQPAATSSATKIYRWIEFANKGEQITEFDESHFQLQGHFESNSSEGHKTYQDRLRSIHFRKEGKTKAEIARLLGRSEQFVAKWWQKDEREIPRPWGVHEYMSKELGSKTATSEATLTENSEVTTAAWWRDIEVRRKYHVDPDVYDELLNNTEWKSNAARTRDFSTGASHVKYDKEGKMKLQGNQSAKYTKGSSPAFDKMLQKFFSEYGLAERTSGIALNWYPDGDSVLGSHRHDCWTALFSFGHERILTIDKTPLLLQDCDLVIFGTQRHGVPKMPEIKGGRITVPIFFYPTHMQMKKQWQTLTDPEDPRRSAELAKLQSTHQLGSDTVSQALWSDPQRSLALEQLLQLGFEEGASRNALQAAGFDAEQAAELLLLAGAGGLDLMMGSAEEPMPMQSELEDVPSSSSSSAVLRSTRWAKRGPSTAEDESLALKLQFEDEGSPPFDAIGCCDVHGADMDAALAAQIEEEENAVGDDKTFLLAQQFEEYEQQMKRDDAERWHGKGDLMQSSFARENLSLETMEKVTCYSLGHGQMSERGFYELLQVSSIKVLYDFRASDHRGEVHSPCPHFTVRALKSSCRVRGIAYKHVALGRESAYGILKHVKTDEAQHALIELVWHAKRGKTCFLGFDPNWKHDSRQVIAEELVKAGHAVKHIDSTGAAEDHERIDKWPDFLVQEEDRLRTLEKQRQAGDLRRQEKSAVDRSSEAVAAKLMRPQQEIDAMDELRAASNQVELERAQRNLARLQRIGDKHGALAGKVVKAAPQWVLEQAREQVEWIAKKKAAKLAAEEAKEKAEPAEEEQLDRASAESQAPREQGTSRSEGGGAREARDPAVAEPGFAAGIAEDFSVECRGCSLQLPWSLLEAGDGLCPECVTHIATASAACGAPEAATASTRSPASEPSEESFDSDPAHLAATAAACEGPAPSRTGRAWGRRFAQKGAESTSVTEAVDPAGLWQ